MKVQIARADSWCALYVDGELRHQNHSIRPEEVLNVLGIEMESRYFEEEETEQMGEFPKHWEDLPEN